MTNRLYTIELSHPGLAAARMLDHVGLSYRTTTLLGGMHPVALRALGFGSVTVPALRLDDGRRVQGSRAIAAALHEMHPDAGLFPEDPAALSTVQEAERWGEEVLQPIPRRMIRRGLRDSLAQRQWFARVASPLPAPQLVGVALTAVVPAFVAQAGATPERVQRDLRELPAVLDHADALIADGVIGGERLNAADFQIGTSLRMLLAMADAGGVVEGRPSEALARRVEPDYPPIPAALGHLA